MLHAASQLAATKAGASSRTPKNLYSLSQAASKLSRTKIRSVLKLLIVFKKAGVAVRSNQAAEHHG
jgi:hypothetical protein